MHQKDIAALSDEEEEENLQEFMLNLAILFIFMSIIGIISCVYQIKQYQSIRRKHSHESTLQSAAHIQNQAECVYKMKAATESSRADMQDSLEREVEELRAFQQQVRGELGTLKTALTVLSQRRQREVLRPDDAESHRKGKTE
jgi:Flp pilus assembly protein TadB